MPKGYILSGDFYRSNPGYQLNFLREQSYDMKQRGWETRMKPIFISPFWAWIGIAAFGVSGIVAVIVGGGNG